jgi:hypothetical protein
MSIKMKPTFWELLNSAILIFLLTIGTQQACFKENKQTEGRIDLRKNILQSTYSLYSEMEFWSDMNTQTVPFAVIGDTINYPKKQKEVVIYLDTSKQSNQSVTVELKGSGFLVLRTLLDTSLQNLSNKYTKEIYDQRLSIDVPIFEEFDRLAKYKETQMTIPNDSLVSRLQKKGWGNMEYIQKWINMNNDFKKKVQSFMNLE